jgi:hypothetical protein
MFAAMLLTASLGIGAPAPLPRPAPDPTVALLGAKDVVGHFDLVWGGGAYTQVFSRDGGSRCTSGPALWVGSWSLDWEGKLTVNDAQWHNGEPGEPVTWTVTFRRNADGRLDPRHLTGTAVYRGHPVEIILKRR